MTREEAIEGLRLEGGIEISGNAMRVAEFLQALSVAITAIQPVSREQVEKMWPGCNYCKDLWMTELDFKPCASGDIGVRLAIGRVSEDDNFGILAYYQHTAAGYIDFPFCPFCGRPITDEAVQMVVERLEALKDEL